MTEQSGRTQKAALYGLSSDEVRASRARHGANVLTPPARTPWWVLYFDKFNDPVIRILIIAAGIAIAAGAIDGAYTEGVGIFCAIVLSTALAFINEYQAAKEFDLLDRSSDETAVRVIRDRHHTSVPRRDVVVGDILVFETGQEIAADGDVVEASDLSIDESRMTGESEPVTKTAKPEAIPKRKVSKTVKTEVPGDATYPSHRLMRGTIVAEGTGKMCVTEVGDETEAGRTARAATEEDTTLTPLNAQLEKLARYIGVAGFSAAAFLFVTLLVRGVVNGELRLSGPQWIFFALLTISALIAGIQIWLPIVFDALEFLGRKSARPEVFKTKGLQAHLAPIFVGLVTLLFGCIIFKFAGVLPKSPEPMISTVDARELLRIFMVAVTVVVVAVPEGLAMSVTLCLAYSVRKMAATNNLVRNMHACETIGAATVICSDKTGTLTLNEMRVMEADFAILNGEKRKGNGTLQTAKYEDMGAARKLVFQAITANSTADLGAAKDARRVLGNPTEGALLLWIEALGGCYSDLRKQTPVVERLAFSTENKFMATVIDPPPVWRKVVHVKGAPEVVLERCSHVLTEYGPEPVSYWRKSIDAKLKGFQERGMRTLGFAFKDCEGIAKEGSDLKEASKNLIWLGFVAIQDPVRSEAPAAIRACRDAGIAVKIVTGDNAVTACEIARQVGLWNEHEPAASLVNGPAFAAMSDAAALAAGRRLKVLARSSPHDKLRLVKLLKGAGEVVAVSGDGANDAPALNFSSVGLSMGKSGTASAREASDIVLLDDSFNSIVSAIKWGRSLYENIQRFIVFQLTINVAALGLMLLGPFVGVKLPLTVPQMLWINIIMDTLAALALASEPPHNSVMARTPRAKDAFIITRAMAQDILVTAGIFLFILLTLIFCYKRDGEFDLHESTVVFTVMVLLQFWNLFNARCFGRTASALKDVFSNRGFVGVAAAIVVGQFVIVQFGGSLFRTQPLEFTAWLKIFALTSIVLWIGEAWRWKKRH